MCALVGICHVSLPGVPVPRVNNAEGSFRQGCNIVMYTVSAPYRKNQDDVIDRWREGRCYKFNAGQQFVCRGGDGGINFAAMIFDADVNIICRNDEEVWRITLSTFFKIADAGISGNRFIPQPHCQCQPGRFPLV